MRILYCLAAVAGLASAQTIKQDDYGLRAGCAENSERLTSLKKGDPVKLRFALAVAGTQCYSVTADVDGKKIQGYVSADALDGLEPFDQARRQASAASVPLIARQQVQSVREVKPGTGKYAAAAEVLRAADALESGRPAEAEQILSKAALPRGNPDAALIRAAALVDLNQADRALEILETALRENKKDARLLALAGVASYKLDDTRNALIYWKESLEIRPDPGVEQMVRKVEREAASDKSSQKTYGTRFLLRYDGAVADPELARSMVSALEEEFSRISFQLGCRADERIVTVVQSRDAYMKTTGAAEWTGGLYDGKIRIPTAAGKQIDAQTRRTFAHEIVHACLANLGRWPAWLHEGMAQKLSGDTIGGVRRERLRALAKDGKLPALASLADRWGGLNASEAAIHYTLALAAMEIFFQKYSHIGARNLLNNPDRLPQITADLDAALKQSTW